MKHLISFATSLLLLVSFAHAEIFEIQEMKQILPAIQPGTLVIFDIDNTILRPQQTLGSDQWYSFEVKRLVQSGKQEADAIDQIIVPWTEIQKKTFVQPVETLTPRLILALKENRISVMALTARPLELAEATQSQLKSIGASIPYNSKSKNHFSVGGDRTTLYDQGVLFVGPKNNKGEILRKFLLEQKIKPQQIVFVDDKPHHVQNVETALLNSGIEYKGFRYGAADAWVKAFDHSITDKQWQTFSSTGELISDEAALLP